jgi:hypothetical protein
MPSVQQIVDYFNNNDMEEYAKKVIAIQDRANELSALETLIAKDFPETYSRLYGDNMEDENGQDD